MQSCATFVDDATHRPSRRAGTPQRRAYVGVGHGSVGHDVVGPAHQCSSGRGAAARHAQGSALLRRRTGDRGLEAADVARYHAYFARPAGKLSGEWTPGYMLDVWTPALLRQAAPDARLLVLLRDPVERFRSGRTLAENRFTVGSTARAAANAAFNRGIYADQLLRLWAPFPREQTLVLQYERCVADTAAQLARTFEFLGSRAGTRVEVDLAAARQRITRTQGHARAHGRRTCWCVATHPRTNVSQRCCRIWTCRSGRGRRDRSGPRPRLEPGASWCAAHGPGTAGEDRKPMGPPEPPRCPAGWQMGPPHFVGVGAQKAGTSWWNAMIHQHPDVHRVGRQAEGAALLRSLLGATLRRRRGRALPALLPATRRAASRANGHLAT